MKPIQRKDEPLNELQALQNHVDYIGREGLKIHEHWKPSSRMKRKVFLLTYAGQSISPVLNYDQMSHFLLGYSRALKPIAL